MAFSPDGKELVAEVSNPVPNRVVRFEAATGTVRWTYETAAAKELAFAADGKAVRYWGTDADHKEMYRWRRLDAATGKPAGPAIDTGTGNVVAIRPDGKVMAVGGFYGHVSQWDLETGKRIDAASADPTGPVTELAFIADGSKVRGWARGWYEWDVKTGKQTRLSPPFDLAGPEIAFGSIDSKWLVRGYSDAELVEVEGQGRHHIGLGNNTDVFRFALDGYLIRSRRNGLKVIDVRSGMTVRRVFTQDGAVAATADGTTAVSITPDGNHLHATRYDLTTGKPVGEWDGRLGDPAMMDRSSGWRAELSPDGRVLAVFFTYLAHPGMGFNQIEELHTALFDARTGRYLSGWWDLAFPADVAFSADRRLGRLLLRGRPRGGRPRGGDRRAAGPAAGRPDPRRGVQPRRANARSRHRPRPGRPVGPRRPAGRSVGRREAGPPVGRPRQREGRAGLRCDPPPAAAPGGGDTVPEGAYEGADRPGG